MGPSLNSFAETMFWWAFFFSGFPGFGQIFCGGPPKTPPGAFSVRVGGIVKGGGRQGPSGRDPGPRAGEVWLFFTHRGHFKQKKKLDRRVRGGGRFVCPRNLSPNEKGNFSKGGKLRLAPQGGGVKPTAGPSPHFGPKPARASGGQSDSRQKKSVGVGPGGPPTGAGPGEPLLPPTRENKRV